MSRYLTMINPLEMLKRDTHVYISVYIYKSVNEIGDRVGKFPIQSFMKIFHRDNLKGVIISLEGINRIFFVFI